jgi:hypothetical protein
VPVRPSLCRFGPVAILLIFVGFAPAVAGAQETTELSMQTAATYSVLPLLERVEVSFAYDFVNPSDDVAFPGFFESLPSWASEVTASDGRQELEVVAFGEDEGFTTWLVAFAEPLEGGDDTTVTLEWVITGNRAGTTIAAGAVAFDAYVPASEGAVVNPIVIEVPADFEPGDGLVNTEGETAEEGRVRYMVDAAGPYEPVSVGFVSRDRFIERMVEGPPDLTIADWSAVGRWADAVANRVDTVGPALDSWFGSRAEPFEVRRGLPTDDHAILALGGNRPYVVVENAAAVSIDHQLAHAWLADVPVEEDWFIEGLAAAFAGGEPILDVTAQVMGPIADEIGANGVRAVIEALRTETISYPGVEPETQPLPPDWRTLLDLLEGVGGAHDAASLFRAAAIDVDTVATDRRTAARIDFAALAGRAGTWALPPLLRLPMAEWDFDTFSAHQAEVSDTILERDNLQAWADDLDLEWRDDGQDLFEAATVDMAAVDVFFAEKADALESFAEAERLVTGDRGLLARIGLVNGDPDDDLAALRREWADGDYDAVSDDGHELAELVEGSVGRGTIRLLVPVAVTLAVWRLLVWFLRRRRPAKNEVSDE